MMQTEALADPLGGSGAGMSFQSFPIWGREGLPVSVHQTAWSRAALVPVVLGGLQAETPL